MGRLQTLILFSLAALIFPSPVRAEPPSCPVAISLYAPESETTFSRAFGTVTAFGRMLSDRGPGLHFHFYREGAMPISEVQLFGRHPLALLPGHIPGPIMQVARFLEDIINPALRTLFPGLLTRLESPTDGIFRTQWEHPHSALPADAAAALVKYGMLDRFLKNQRLIEDYPHLHRLLRAIEATGRGGSRLLALLAGTQAVQLLTDDRALPSVEQALRDANYSPKDDEIQLLVESVPFPHLAIRIGDTIYSYGVKSLSSSVPEAYFNSGRLLELMREVHEIYEHRDQLDPEVLRQLRVLIPEEDARAAAENGAPPDFSGRVLGGVASGFGLNRMSRTIQVVTIRVGREKRDELRRYFEMHKGDVYDNRTWVNDCASMVLRPLGTLGLFGPLVDPSPSTIVTVLSASRLAGNDSIRNVFQISVDRPEDARLQVLRNAYINFLEGELYLGSLLYNFPERFHLDATHSAESLQWRTPETEQQIADWRIQVESELREDNRVRFFGQVAQQIANANQEDPAVTTRRHRLLSLMEPYFTEQMRLAREALEDPNSLLRTIFVSTYRLEYLTRERNRLRTLLGVPPGT